MADRPHRVGQQLGNYRLIRLLGAGGFAEVYLAEHIHLGTQAAVKVLHAQLTHDNVEAFRTEARTIAHLVHPHIVRVLEFGVEGATSFLVMDYASNGTLRNLHPKGSSLAITTIITYIKQVADALQYAHNEKVIHRDIKPENMLVGRSNEVFLSDFGIALVAQSSRYQNIQEVIGTVVYMSPEQIQGKPRPASDQYSLGIVVYEWLCGNRPFHGSFTEVCAQHMFAPPPSLREKLPTLSPDLEQVVMIALAKNPKQRFASVQAFATALEQASQSEQNQSSLASRPTSPPAPPSVLVTPPHRFPEPIMLPTNRSSALEQGNLPEQNPPSVSLPVVTPPSQPLPPTVPTTPSNRIPKQTTEVPPSDHPFQRGDTANIKLLALQPKKHFSRRTVIVGLTTAGIAVASGSILWWVFSPHPLYTYKGHANWVSSVVWSPDGKRIASGSNDNTVQVWNATDGSHVFIYEGHSSNICSVAWSPDGKRIASGSNDNTVQVWDATDGSHVFTYKGHTNTVSSVAWSPDGKRIASASNDQTAQVWNATDGSHVSTYRDHSSSVCSVAWSPDGKCIASASEDTTVQVWNATDGSHVFTYQGHANTVSSVAWLGQRIASASNDQTVQVWNATDGSHVFTYKGHTNWVSSVAWSPDGQRIASSSWDTTVQVWNATNGSHVLTYQGHANAVPSVAWSPNSKYIASGSNDQTVQVWVAS